MTKKAAMLKNLKVKVDKKGHLTPKSLEDVQGLVKPSVAEKIASRITVHDGVEAVGFAGLIAVNYYGIDLLGMFLGQATKVVEKVVETVEDFNTVVTAKYGEAGIAITALALATVPGLVIGVGMPLVVVGDTVYLSAQKAIKKEKTEVEMIQRTIEGIEGQIALIHEGGIGLAIPDPEHPGRFIPAPEEQRLTYLEGEITRLEKLKTDLQYDKKMIEARDRRILEDLERMLFVKKVAIATGMSYAEKKFLESYNYFKAIENIPFVE